MKSMALHAVATAAALVVNASGALSQEACSKAYGACMTACVEKVTRDAQDICMISCQDKNNQCSREMFSGRLETSSVVRSSADDKKAREITSPPPRRSDVPPGPADAGKGAGASRAEGAPRKVDVPPRKQSAPSPVREIPAEN